MKRIIKRAEQDIDALGHWGAIHQSELELMNAGMTLRAYEDGNVKNEETIAQAVTNAFLGVFRMVTILNLDPDAMLEAIKNGKCDQKK